MKLTKADWVLLATLTFFAIASVLGTYAYLTAFTQISGQVVRSIR